MYGNVVASSVRAGSVPPAKGSLVLAVFLVMLALTPTSASRAGAVGNKIVVGELEIIVGQRKVSAGGFPNTTMNPFKRTAVAEYSIHHRGLPLDIDVGGDRRVSAFNMIHVLRDAPEPAILVPAGGFQIVTARNHAVQARALGVANPHMRTMQWLDGNDGQPGNERNTGGLGRYEVADIELRGGRWLLLGRSVVLDVATLRHYVVRPWIESSSGLPMQGLNASVVPALAFSPRATQYVLLGSGRDDIAHGDFDHALLVVDIPGGTSYAIDIPPALRQDVLAGRVTGDWIRRHFRWREIDGQERLEFHRGK